jgi:hypothetical protein
MKDIDEVYRKSGFCRWVDDVRDFNEQKLPFLELADTPTLPSWEDRVYLLASLESEQSELSRAFATSDIVEMVDALLDSIYVQVGILIKCGIPIEACWDEVQRSNMAKNPAAPGTMGRKTLPGLGGGPDRTSMKPDGWVPPRIAEILAWVAENKIKVR